MRGRFGIHLYSGSLVVIDDFTLLAGAIITRAFARARGSCRIGSPNRRSQELITQACVFNKRERSTAVRRMVGTFLF